MRDLKTSKYCDFEFSNDLQMSTGLSTLTRIVEERLQTQVGDFKLNPDIGTVTQSLLGKGIDDRLIEDLEVNLVYSLTYDGLLQPSQVSIIIVPQGANKLYVRVTIQSPYGTIRTSKTLEGSDNGY